MAARTHIAKSGMCALLTDFGGFLRRLRQRRSASDIELPCAANSSSHISTVWLVVSVAAVFGSSRAAW